MPQPPLTPQQQIRMQVRAENLPKMAELLLQIVKGTRSIRLSDLRSEASQAVFIGKVMMWLDGLDQSDLRCRVHEADAHLFARQDKEQEDVMAQARQDSRFFGDPMVQAFLTTNPRFCALCRSALVENRVTVHVTEGIAVEAHGKCCANNPGRFAFLSEFTYILIGGEHV